MVPVKYITESAFTPYGGLVAAGLQNPTTTTNSIAQKSLEVVPSTNLYSQAPSKTPGRNVVHIESVKPKELQYNGTSRSLRLDRMERHAFSGVEYLAIVADGNAEGTTPDISTVKVFLAREGQGVCYGPGVWHASLSVVGQSPITFVVIQSMNGLAEEDCESYLLKEEEVVEITL